MDQATMKTLVHIGLTEKQATIYLALLSLDEAPASAIASQAHMNRSVTYEVLKELAGLGYVTESHQTNVKRYKVVDPQKIFQNASARIEDFKFMLPLLRAMHHRGQKKPQVEFFEGAEAAMRVYQTFDIAKHRRIMTAFSRMEKIFTSEFKRWIKRSATITAPSPTQYLLLDEPLGRSFAKTVKHQKNLSFRFFSKAQDFSMDLVIADDTIAITSFDPIYIIVIHSTNLARSASTLFDLAWGHTPTKLS